MLFLELQKAIARRIGDDEYFTGSPLIPVAPRCSKRALSLLAEGMAVSQMGVLVWPGKGRFIRGGTPRPAAELDFRIKVYQNPSLDLTGYPAAEDAAWAAARLLWLWVPTDRNGTAITNGNFVLGEIENGEMEWKPIGGGSPSIIFVSEFTATISASDTTRAVRSARTLPED